MIRWIAITARFPAQATQTFTKTITIYNTDQSGSLHGRANVRQIRYLCHSTKMANTSNYFVNRSQQTHSRLSISKAPITIKASLILKILESWGLILHARFFRFFTALVIYITYDFNYCYLGVAQLDENGKPRLLHNTTLPLLAHAYKDRNKSW